LAYYFQDAILKSRKKLRNDELQHLKSRNCYFDKRKGKKEKTAGTRYIKKAQKRERKM
jgi:hypothetical protein